MATIVLPTDSRNAAADAVVDRVDLGSGVGKVRIYDTGKANLLGTCPMTKPAFGNSATGVATAAAITNDTNADFTATAAEFDCVDSDDNVIFTGDVGTGSEALVLNDTSIVTGGIIAVNSLTYTQPAS